MKVCCKIQQILSAMQLQTGTFFHGNSIKYGYSLLHIILISYFTFIFSVRYLYSDIAFSKKDEFTGLSFSA